MSMALFLLVIVTALFVIPIVIAAREQQRRSEAEINEIGEQLEQVDE